MKVNPRININDWHCVSAGETFTVVEAVATAVHSDTPGLGNELEAAQVKAIEQALAEGVSIKDSAELLRRKAAARQTVLDSVTWGG